MKTTHSLALIACLSLGSCGPVAWNNHAEYLPAPRKTVQQVSSSPIRELVAELPPDKVQEADAAGLANRVRRAEVRTEGGIERLTFPATATAPERTFHLIQRPGTTLLKMVVKPPGKAAETHVFRRATSYWDYMIQPAS